MKTKEQIKNNIKKWQTKIEELRNDIKHSFNDEDYDTIFSCIIKIQHMQTRINIAECILRDD